MKSKPDTSPASLRAARFSTVTRDSLALTTLLCAAGNAAAQDTQPNDGADSGSSSDGELPEYVVDGVDFDSLYKADSLSSPKYSQPLRDVPQSITVIPDALLEDQAVSTLRDALRNVSGISIQAGEGGVPAGDNLSIRGFNARTDLFIDGVRDFGAYSRDTFNFEAVEVTKGPASSNGGRGSTGGSVNLVTKEAHLNDATHVDTTVGTDDYYRGTIDWNQTISDGTALRVNGMWHENDTPDRGAADNKRWGIATSLGFGLGEEIVGETIDPTGKNPPSVVTAPSDTRMWINFLHVEEDNQPDYGIPWVPDSMRGTSLDAFVNGPAPVPYDRYYGLIHRDFEEVSTTMASLHFEHDFNDNVTLRELFRVGRTDRYNIVTPPRFSGNGTDITRDDVKDRDEVYTSIVSQTDLMFSFDTGPLAHDAVLGIELASETNERHSLQAPRGPETSLFHPDPYGSVTGGVSRTGESTYAEAFSASVYLFDTVALTEWLDVTGGFRWDHFDLDYTTRGEDGTSHLNRVDNMPSGRAAVVLKPVENASVYFGYGTSFNPAGEGLSLSSGGGRGGATNFELEPEESQTFELGTKWDVLDQRLSLSAALFQTDKTNARTIDPADPDQLTVLDGEQRVQGFELGISGDILPWWHVYGGYTYLDSEVTSSKDPAEVGKTLAHTPQNSFSLWTQIDLPGGFFVGGGPQFVDDRFSNTANNRTAPSYLLWDAAIGYQVNESLTLRLNVQNAGDEDYIDRVGGGHFIPGPGRSVMLTASMKF